MADFKVTSLDVLAEAATALFYINSNQENTDREINYATVPKKRKLLDRYQAEQENAESNLISQFINARLNSQSSGYSSESEVKSSDQMSSSNNTSSPEPPFSSQASSPESCFDHDGSASELHSPKRKKPTVRSKNNSTTKKSSSQKSRTKKSSTSSNSSSTNSMSSSSNDENNACYNEYVKKVSITPKISSGSSRSKSSTDDVFDDNIKIEVKMPKLTYTLRGMRKRKPSTKTPDHLKDKEYFDKRERNNLAARKSRNNKNATIRTSAMKLKQLEDEHDQLTLQLGEQIEFMKAIQERMGDNPQLKQRITNLINEKELVFFSKVLNLN